MAELHELLERVAAAPDGSKIAAVFDYDGTLIEGFSGLAILRTRLKRRQVSPLEVGRIAIAAMRGIRTVEEFEAFLAWSLRAYAGKPVAELREWGRKLFNSELAPRVRPETWALVQAHKAKGHTIVLASSATMLQVEAIGEAMGADHVVCTRLEVKDGLLTGRVEGQTPWAEHKAAGVAALAQRVGLDLEQSFAYSDGDEDVALLAEVGNPVAVNPRPELAREAEERGWPILQGASTSAGLSPVSLARTAAAYGGFLGGTAVAAGIGVVNRSARSFVDTATGLGADIGLGLSGITVEIVEGREHLWAHRPSVFIFNHRSNADAFVLMKLLREGITAVAKKEIEKLPIFGPLFKFGGVAFIDRGDSTQARQAIQPVLDKITSEGLSLVIAPEGTRSPLPEIGPFKKGAFHIARQAGVPIVPIVLHGVGELLPRGDQLLQGGLVKVIVLPPVDVGRWPLEEMATRVASVRQDMVEALKKLTGQ